VSEQAPPQIHLDAYPDLGGVTIDDVIAGISQTAQVEIKASVLALFLARSQAENAELKNHLSDQSEELGE
jgi:hypothetical protein